MKILNPFSGKIEEVQPLSPDSCKTICVVTVANEVLHVEPTDHYRVYMIIGTAAPNDLVEFYRALGHTVVLLNEEVSVEKVAGSWRVTPLGRHQNSPSTVHSPSNRM